MLMNQLKSMKSARLCPAAFWLAIAPALWGQAGAIATFAGGGTLSGNAANNQQASSALLYGNPFSEALDSAGNVYIGDGAGARVWKVSPAGVITTVAGGGTAPGTGDGGPAINAQITVSGIALDQAGNLYISGATLRKVTPAGIISTIAQVNGTNVAIDGAGNLYVPEILASRIVKVDPAGVVTTVAGNGTSGHTGDGGLATMASLSLPQGVAADQAGNIYFCEGAVYVRKVDTSGILSTVAGSGSGLATGDGGPARQAGMTPTGLAVASNGDLYIADTGGNRIRRVNSSGIITTVAGGGLPAAAPFGDGGPATSAYLSRPGSAAVDALGNIYIGDDGHQRVRKVASGVAASPITTNPSALSFSYTLGAANPASQNVVIAVIGATLSFTAAASTTSDGDWLHVSPTSGPANNTLAVSVTPAGLAAGTYNGTIAITPSGAGNPPAMVSVTLTVSEPARDGAITTVAGNGFVTLAEGVPAVNSGLAPTGVTVDSAGNLYISDSVNNRVRKVTAAGTIQTIAGTGAFGFAGDGGAGTAASIFTPLGLAADGQGDVYFADSLNYRVRKLDSSGIITTVAGSGTLGTPVDGGPAIDSPMSPSAVALDGSGNLYIADYANNRVRKVTAGGTITTVAGSGLLPGFSGDGGPAAGALLAQVAGVAVDTAGNIFIADIGNNRIRKVNTAGIITTVAGNGTRGFAGDGGPAIGAQLNMNNAHVGIAVDRAGNLYIADVGNQRVRKVDASGNITTVAGNGIAGFSGDQGPATAAGLSSPQDVAVDSAGNLYIADGGEQPHPQGVAGRDGNRVAGDHVGGERRVIFGQSGIDERRVGDDFRDRVRVVDRGGVHHPATGVARRGVGQSGWDCGPAALRVAGADQPAGAVGPAIRTGGRGGDRERSGLRALPRDHLQPLTRHLHDAVRDGAGDRHQFGRVAGGAGGLDSRSGDTAGKTGRDDPDPGHRAGAGDALDREWGGFVGRAPKDDHYADGADRRRAGDGGVRGIVAAVRRSGSTQCGGAGNSRGGRDAADQPGGEPEQRQGDDCGGQSIKDRPIRICAAVSR